MIEDTFTPITTAPALESCKLKNSCSDIVTSQTAYESGGNVDAMPKSLKSDDSVMLPSMFGSPQQQIGLSIRTNGLLASEMPSRSGDFCDSLSSFFSESASGIDDIRDNSLNGITASIGDHIPPLSASVLPPSQEPNVTGYGSSIDFSTSQFPVSASGAPPGMDWMNQSKVRKRKQTSPLLSKFMEENMALRSGRLNSAQGSFEYGYNPSDISNSLYSNGSPTTMYSNTSSWNGSSTGYVPHLNPNVPSVQTEGFYSSSNYLSSPALITPNSYGTPASVSVNAATIKVPMAPVRAIQQEAKKPAPLLLPFHHKNDNRIIPQTFHHQSFLLSQEEIYSVKSTFLGRIKEIDFDNITVVELKNFLREFNLASGGKKSILVERIRQIAEWLKNERLGQPHNESFLSQYHNDNASTSTFHSGAISVQSSKDPSTDSIQYPRQPSDVSLVVQSSDQDKETISLITQPDNDILGQEISLDELNSGLVL